jgi:hypothetical protein
MTPSAVGIGRSQHGDYFVMQDGRIIVDGPFKTKEQAESAKADIRSRRRRPQHSHRWTYSVQNNFSFDFRTVAARWRGPSALSPC